MQWPRLLAYITGRVDKELLVRNEYLAAENRILRAKIKGRLQLWQGEKRSLAEITHRLGRKALAEVAVAAKPETNLRWFRKLVARKFDGSACRQSVGRPRVEKTIEDHFIVRHRISPYSMVSRHTPLRLLLQFVPSMGIGISLSRSTSTYLNQDASLVAVPGRPNNGREHGARIYQQPAALVEDLRDDTRGGAIKSRGQRGTLREGATA